MTTFTVHFVGSELQKDTNYTILTTCIKPPIQISPQQLKKKEVVVFGVTPDCSVN